MRPSKLRANLSDRLGTDEAVSWTGIDAGIALGAPGTVDPSITLRIHRASPDYSLSVVDMPSVAVVSAAKWWTDDSSISIVNADIVEIDFGRALQMSLRLEGIAEFARQTEVSLQNHGRGRGSSTDIVISIDDPDGVGDPAAMDPVVVDKSSSRFSAGAGNDSVVLQFNVAAGVQGSITLSGGEGNDTITGDEGTQQLLGGAGVDVLTGGADRDIFVFEAGQIDGDRITDFNAAEGDRLVFRGFAISPTVEILATEIRVIDSTGAIETILLG